MSTLTQAQPGTAVPARLRSVPLAVTFLAEFTSLTSFFLLLSVMPMLAAVGAGSSAAGPVRGWGSGVVVRGGGDLVDLRQAGVVQCPAGRRQAAAPLLDGPPQ